jgi:6-phosphogluconolactonase (cycloisomerase 2 family)
MRVIRRLRPHSVVGATLLSVAASAAVAAPASAAQTRDLSTAAGHVYLNDNTAGTNTIAAFRRHPDGSLTPLAGSPFSAGGAGSGAGLPSQGAIQTAGDGRYELAVDAGSNEVSVLRIAGDGSLDPVPGGVVSSGGVDPVSIAVHDGLVYVANAGAAAPNLTGFQLTGNGHLIRLSDATVGLPANSQPGDVLFNPTGTKLVTTLINSSQIASYTVGNDGGLHAAAGSPFPAQGVGPFGSAFSPAHPDQLFVSNAHNGAGLGTVSAYDDGHGGTLFSIGSSPFGDQQTAPCWVAITSDGRYLFAVNTGSGTISRYAIADDGQLALLGSTPVSANGGVGAVDPGLSPDGRTLYVNESTIAAVGAFAVHDGNLTEEPGSPVPLPTGATAAGISVN